MRIHIGANPPRRFGHADLAYGETKMDGPRWLRRGRMGHSDVSVCNTKRVASRLLQGMPNDNGPPQKSSG